MCFSDFVRAKSRPFSAEMPDMAQITRASKIAEHYARSFFCLIENMSDFAV
jgi:hypothetical protein